MKHGGITFHVKRDAEQLALPLSDAQANAIALFHDLLLERAPALGLVSEFDLGRLYDRHIRDSLCAATAFLPADARAYDIGSGAGLPGLVLAATLPGVSFRLVETMRRRVAFLEYAVERLGLTNVEILARRVESLSDHAELADVVTARAFAPPLRSWEAARSLLRPGGRLIYFLGGNTHLEEGELGGKKEPPATIEVRNVLDSATMLAIMSRR